MFVGPATAYNLICEKSTTNAASKIDDLIQGQSRLFIILSFGEIDLMEHIYKASVNRDISFLESIRETAFATTHMLRDL